MVRKRNKYNLDTNRIIGHLEIDCFYVQVDQRDNPEFVGHPCATKQKRRHKY
jgi:nucleotidyltransferase/DNA polymerase involved in DNA repair